jgi:hypothetical protein
MRSPVRIASVLILLVSGCAVLSAGSLGSSSQMNAMVAEANEMAKRSQEANQLAETQCQPLQRREVGWEEEREVGAELAVSFTAQLGHLYLDGATEKDPQKLLSMLEARTPVTLPPGGRNAVSAHVAVVGRNLAKFSSRPDLQWVFGVIENDSPHAFATPGGFVFVTTGLLKKMTNEAQLAPVLGHEIAHVTQKAMLEKHVEAIYKQCIASNYAKNMIERGVPSNPESARFAKEFVRDLDLHNANPAFKKFLYDVLMMSVASGYAREDEFAADRTALELVSFAGYDPVQYEQFLLTWKQDKHPDSKERALKLEALRNGDLKDFARGTAKPELGKIFAPLSAP